MKKQLPGMLVLSRKVGEAVWIGDTLVTVVRDGRGSIRLGIQAPKDVPILRSELVDGSRDASDSKPTLKVVR